MFTQSSPYVEDDAAAITTTAIKFDHSLFFYENKDKLYYFYSQPHSLYHDYSTNIYYYKLIDIHSYEME